MTSLLREGLRYLTIGLCFGLIWAVIQYTNGSITGLNALIGPVIIFGAAGLLLWGLRRVISLLRRSK